MTREEAIARIRIHKNVHKMDEPRAINISEALDMAIKVLEQKPCEDCISRKAVLEQIYSWSKDEFLRVTNPFYYLRKRIKALPPITPTQNTRQVARWVNNIHDLPICSKCGNYAVFDHAIDDYYYSDYCPKCGAKMENAVEKIYKERSDRK